MALKTLTLNLADALHHTVACLEDWQPSKSPAESADIGGRIAEVEEAFGFAPSLREPVSDQVLLSGVADGARCEEIVRQLGARGTPKPDFPHLQSLDPTVFSGGGMELALLTGERDLHEAEDALNTEARVYTENDSASTYLFALLRQGKRPLAIGTWSVEDSRWVQILEESRGRVRLEWRQVFKEAASRMPTPRHCLGGPSVLPDGTFLSCWSHRTAFVVNKVLRAAGSLLQEGSVDGRGAVAEQQLLSAVQQCRLDVSACGEAADLLLHWAVARGWLRAAAVLAGLGARPGLMDSSGQGVLAKAVTSGRPELLRLVVALGALDRQDSSAEVLAMQKFIPEGMREESISALIFCLETADRNDVLEALLETVGVLAQRGDARACTAVSEMFGSEHRGVRIAALAAFGELAPRGEERAVLKLGEVLECDSWSDGDVRKAALKALGKVAAEADESAIALAFRALEDECWEVRRAAAQVLGTVAGKGNGLAIAEAGARLAHQDAGVRGAAIEALEVLADRGDEKALFQAFARLRHRDAGVRSIALRAVGALAEPGDEESIAAVSTMLEDDDWGVRSAAAEILATLAGRGHEKAITAACAQLEHELSGVRWLATEALGKLAERGSESAIVAASAKLGDANSGVRDRAKEALLILTEGDEERALAAASAGLRSECAGVRRAAVSALCELAEGDALFSFTEASVAGDRGIDSLRSAAIRAGWACLGDEDASVRRAAADALLKLAGPKDGTDAATRAVGA